MYLHATSMLDTPESVNACMVSDKNRWIPKKSVLQREIRYTQLCRRLGGNDCSIVVFTCDNAMYVLTNQTQMTNVEYKGVCSVSPSG